jgi:hypothetical protein
LDRFSGRDIATAEPRGLAGAARGNGVIGFAADLVVLQEAFPGAVEIAAADLVAEA